MRRSEDVKLGLGPPHLPLQSRSLGPPAHLPSAPRSPNQLALTTCFPRASAGGRCVTVVGCGGAAKCCLYFRLHACHATLPCQARPGCGISLRVIRLVHWSCCSYVRRCHRPRLSTLEPALPSSTAHRALMIDLACCLSYCIPLGPGFLASRRYPCARASAACHRGSRLLSPAHIRPCARCMWIASWPRLSTMVS